MLANFTAVYIYKNYMDYYMVCDNCDGQYGYDYIKVVECTLGEGITNVFCSYTCLRHWYGWRRS